MSLNVVVSGCSVENTTETKRKKNIVCIVLEKRMSDGRIAFCIATQNEKGVYILFGIKIEELLLNAVELGALLSHLSFVQCFVCICGCGCEYEGLIL